MRRAAASTSNRVPGVREVVPGVAVNIVQKADQPTGRTVSGSVRDVLTRGNHPRGIKVRLSDGRVGRVQTMAGGESSAPAEPPSAHTGDGAAESTFASGSYHGPRQRRNEEWQAPLETQFGLDAYVKESKPQKRGRRKGGQEGGRDGTGMDAGEQSGMGTNEISAAPGEVVTCPVCGKFEGDEASVTHHVSGHFDS